MNIVGTRKVIELCKKMRNLEAFIHLSTAFQTYDPKVIEEKVYESPAPAQAIIDLADSISDDLDARLTPSLIKPRPNTYTYTKAITEAMVVEECLGKIPFAIVRPSLVGSSWKEPFPGWIDTYNIFTGLTKAIAYNSSLQFYDDKVERKAINIIPLDISVNMLISQG